MTRIAILDDWQGVAQQSAEWAPLKAKADVVFFERSLGEPSDIATALADFDIILAMRERTHFPATLIEKLPKLSMIALTGSRSWTLDTQACTARGIVVSNTGGDHSSAATAEIAVGLILAAARAIPTADASMRAGEFQRGVPNGIVLEGKTLGVLGLGKIGSRVARFGQALGMDIIAWSQNMTEDKAREAGAKLVDKPTLLSQADVLSLHVVLSDRTRGIVGAADLDRMKNGAIIVNTSRGPLIDETALLAQLQSGRLSAGLDVYGKEPLPKDHPLRKLPNVVLTPHLGYCTREVYAQFYGESIENILSFMAGKPIRVLNDEVLKTTR